MARTKQETEITRRATDETVGVPKKGDVYRCEQCGMEFEVTADCGCDDPTMVSFQCCGREMSRD